MDSNRYNQAPAYATGVNVDAGLQAFMQRVYNTMGIGLAVTGIVAFFVSQSEAAMQTIFGTPLQWVVIFAPLAYLFLGLTPRRIAGMAAPTVKMHFVIFSGLMGLSMSALFAVYTGESIAKVFFITAATFAATSIYGYTTKRNLAGMGSFLLMGLIGIVIASIVNLFLGSEMTAFIVSILGVVIFTGLTAYETQMLKETYAYGAGREANDKLAYMGALSLYLSFVNLFQSLLHLMGNRE